MKSNKWLINEKELKEISDRNKFKTDFYLLCSKIYTTVLGFPTPCISTFFEREKYFCFMIGKNILKIKFNDEEIVDYNFCEIIRVWAYKFFPHYTIEEEIEKEYNTYELNKLVENKNIDELINEKELILKNFKIEKIFVKNDSFLVKIGNDNFIMMTKANIPLSLFLKKLRRIKNNEDKKEFIEKNTKKIMQINDINKNIDIDYKGKQLEEFFKIRIVSYFNENFKRIGELIYRWGKFIFRFENEIEIENTIFILEKSKNNFKKSKNIDDYLMSNFKVIIEKVR